MVFFCKSFLLYYLILIILLINLKLDQDSKWMLFCSRWNWSLTKCFKETCFEAFKNCFHEACSIQSLFCNILLAWLLWDHVNSDRKKDYFRKQMCLCDIGCELLKKTRRQEKAWNFDLLFDQDSKLVVLPNFIADI